MTYTINIERIKGSLFLVKVEIIKENVVIKKGETKINVPISTLPENKTQEDIIREYIENDYLLDLRKNFYEELSELVLPIDNIEG